MEDAARYADEIAIMHEGRCVLTGAPRELFADAETLQTYRLQLPRIVKFQHHVEKMMNKKLSKICLTEEELADEIARVVKGRDHSMMEKMIFGRYIPGNSFVHRLDPRSKLLFVFAFIIIVFLANNAITYGLLISVYACCYFNVPNSLIFFN